MPSPFFWMLRWNDSSVSRSVQIVGAFAKTESLRRRVRNFQRQHGGAQKNRFHPFPTLPTHANERLSAGLLGLLTRPRAR